ENTLFAKSTPMVIVLMETSSSADGCVATPSWPSRPKGEEVSFYSFEADGFAVADGLHAWVEQA
ncbi:MAG: hypothetical protein ABI386_06890, partial [Rhodanobacter sp.]